MHLTSTEFRELFQGATTVLIMLRENGNSHQYFIGVETRVGTT
jgi:hypothetical protein